MKLLGHVFMQILNALKKSLHLFRYAKWPSAKESDHFAWNKSFLEDETCINTLTQPLLSNITE